MEGPRECHNKNAAHLKHQEEEEASLNRNQKPHNHKQMIAGKLALSPPTEAIYPLMPTNTNNKQQKAKHDTKHPSQTTQSKNHTNTTAQNGSKPPGAKDTPTAHKPSSKIQVQTLVQETMFGSHNSINVSSQKHLNQLKHYGETMKRAHDLYRSA